MAELRGVILDIDGTLVDSNDAHARAWQDALETYGYNPLYGEIRQLIGMGGDQVLPILIGVDSKSVEGQEISDLRAEIFQTRYLPRLRPFPQARALLVQMRAVGLTLVVGSSAKQEELAKLLVIANVADLIQAVTAADDAEHSKPEADIVEVALAKMAHPRNTVVMLGDTPYDLEAATQAGIAMIALRCGGWQDTDLPGALAIYDDPADLLANFATSPLAAGQLVAV
ncbi:MAG: HAD family hydrolase [Caldilinea sp. CFX5]|nr:HAD family hydrolase [Caldilinea sp. CFX5]